MKQSKYIIYALQDPTTFELRYIGKSVSGLNRPKQHTYPSYISKDKSYKGNWIRSLLNNGFQPIIKVIQTLNNHIELIEAEIYWIEYFKNLGCPLTNSTKGGSGSMGYKWKDTDVRRLKPHPMKGKKLTDEQKTKISKMNKIVMNTPEMKDKLVKRKSGSKFIDNYGNYYESIFDAQRKTGFCRDSIRDTLEGRKESIGGYKFKYIIKSTVKVLSSKLNKPAANCKKVQDENGKIFNSLSECAEFHNMPISTVYWQLKRNIRFKEVQ